MQNNFSSKANRSNIVSYLMSLMSGLTASFSCASAFSLLQWIGLVELCEENLASYRHLVGKEGIL